MKSPLKDKLMRFRTTYSAMLDAADQLAQEIDRNSGAYECDSPRVRAIMEAVALTYSITVKSLVSRARDYVYVRPRHVAMYLARTETDYSLQRIGREFLRDHGTVIHAVKSIEDAMENDPRLVKEIGLLRSKLAWKMPREERAA